jgi:hypothetical protein
VVEERGYDDDSDSLGSKWPSTLKIEYGDLPYFPVILAEAPEDPKLARLLWEVAVQYKDDHTISEGRKRMADSALRYIEVCGLIRRLYSFAEITDERRFFIRDAEFLFQSTHTGQTVCYAGTTNQHFQHHLPNLKKPHSTRFPPQMNPAHHDLVHLAHRSQKFLRYHLSQLTSHPLLRLLAFPVSVALW